MDRATPFPRYKNVVVLGASYGGAHAAQVLAASLPDDYRVILVDRNSHANHLYVLPRFAVLPGHERKAFIPYSNVFYPKSPLGQPCRHLFLNAHVTKITAAPSSQQIHTSSSGSLKNKEKKASSSRKTQGHADGPGRKNYIHLSRSFPEHGPDFQTNRIEFEYAIYALGGKLPAPIDVWSEEDASGLQTHPRVALPSFASGSKGAGIAWLQARQDRIRDSERILVVGGGALGIQFAADIADMYPNKKVILLHSRNQLLPRFDLRMHDEILSSLRALGVEIILNDRLDLSSASLAKKTTGIQKKSGPTSAPRARRVVRTLSGREIAVDLLLLCTGQQPNTDLLAASFPGCVDPKTGLARVDRSMQLRCSPPPTSTMSWFSQTLSVIGRLPVVGPTLSLLNRTLPVLPVIAKTLSWVLSQSKVQPLPSSTAAASVRAGDAPMTTSRPLFAIGDAADAFGAIKAGYTAYQQGEVAAKNILKLIEADEGRYSEMGEKGSRHRWTDEGDEKWSEGRRRGVGMMYDVDLIEYQAGHPQIKVTLGLRRCVYETGPGVEGFGTKEDGLPDLNAGLMWPMYGIADPGNMEA